MNAVTSAQGPSPIALQGAVGGPSVPGTGSLLPAPSADAMPGDAMSMLYQLMQKNRETSMDAGKQQVESRKQDKEIQIAAQAAALAQAEDDKASAEKWGILGKVASVIAIAVSTVASVCSCGAASGLLIAATVLSVMAFAEGELHALGKLTGNEENSKWFTLGLGVASAVCSGGAGIASTTATLATKVIEVAGQTAKVASEVVGASVTSKEGSAVAMGLGIAGAVGGGAASMTGVAKSTEVVTKAVVVAKVVAASVELGNAGLSATGSIVVSQYEANGIDAGANAKIAAQQMAKLDRLIEWVIDGVKETDGSHKRAMETLQGAMQTQGQTLVTASSMRA
ncbi:hypothetical protein BH09MYX1_BH09MYX1_61150 [soil metagenome]